MERPLISKGGDRCIYCRERLRPDTKEAHAIPTCLGGRLKSTRTVCSGCNQFLGTLEANLCSDLREVSAAVGGLTGRGEKITIRLTNDLGTFAFWRGRGDRQVDSPRFEQDRRSLVIPLPAGEENQARLLATHLWKAGKTPADIEGGTVWIEEQASPPPANLGQRLVESKTIIGNRVHRRVFAKMALEVLAVLRPEAARHYALRQAREFVRYDEGDISFKPDSRSVGSGLVHADVELPRLAHAVEVWRSGAHLLARMTLFGELRFTASLTGSWDGPPLAILQALDPSYPARWITTAEDKDGEALALWHDEVSVTTVDQFEKHIATVLRELAVEAAAIPVQRAPPPELTELRELIQKHYDALVAKKGPKTK